MTATEMVIMEEAGSALALQKEAESPQESASYQPISPFIREPAYQKAPLAEAVAETAETAGEIEHFANPFLTQYTLQGNSSFNLEAEQFAEIVDELYDEEFEEAVEDLVGHLREVADGYVESFSAEDTTSNMLQRERYLDNYLEPLIDELENQIDRMQAEASAVDNEQGTDQRLDQFLMAFEAETAFEDPAVDYFFKKAFKKIKRAVKKGVKIARKVGKVIGKLSPIRFVLSKLRKLARPLLKRVLKFALNKLPRRFRPFAKKIADKLIKRIAGETEDAEAIETLMAFESRFDLQAAVAMDPHATMPPASIVAQDFDAMLAGFLTEGEGFEQTQEAIEYMSGVDLEGAIDGDLDGARDRFVSALMHAEEGDDVEPAVEEFVTAILAGAKIAIKIIGRKRVVKALAKIISRLIRRFVGRRMAKPLSRALADAGLRLLRLEDEVEQRQVVADMVAGTVEDAVERLLTALPADVESDAEVDMYLSEAFEAAAQEHFPAELLREDLQHEAGKGGVWQLRSRRSRARRYKKYTKVLSIKLTPASLAKVKSFGGRSLANELQGVRATGVNEVRVHLFEVLRGARLSDIAALEKDVPGLGRATRSALQRFHPLTCHAAAVLMPHYHRLCRDVDAKYLRSRSRLKVGQRLYYLELPSGAAPAAVGDTKTSRVAAHLNLKAREVQIVTYVSEAEALQLTQAAAGRGQKIVGAIRRLLKGQLPGLLKDLVSKQVKISKELGQSEQLLGQFSSQLSRVGDRLAKSLLQRVTRSLIKQLEGGQLAAGFAKAAKHPDDGISVVFTLTDIPEVFDLLTGNLAKKVKALGSLNTGVLKGKLTIAVKPGYQALGVSA